MNNTDGYAKGPHYQRTKFLICYCLNCLHNDKGATCQELMADICLLSIGSIRTCCSRMNTCYIRPGKRYKRPYLRKLRYRTQWWNPLCPRTAPANAGASCDGEHLRTRIPPLHCLSTPSTEAPKSPGAARPEHSSDSSCLTVRHERMADRT